MNEYRKAVELDGDQEYWFVSMGPIPRLKNWAFNTPVNYPFPSVEAATRFAQMHKGLNPDRVVTIDYPDGRRWDGKQWIA